MNLSADLRLVASAMERVQAPSVEPEIRPEAVARGRALVASGELGADLDALADRLMDTLVFSHDDDPS